MSTNHISYSSIGELHTSLVRREFTPRELYDYIREAQQQLHGSEVEYHNLSVEFSHQDCTPFAADVAALGAQVYPMSTDLLADIIKYSQQSGNTERCKQGISLLKKIDRKYWTWRTFVFVIDFLKDSLSSLGSVQEYENNLNEAKAFIDDFKKFIPHEERAYVAEAEMYLSQNNYDQAISALTGGATNIPVAPQCCMKLADLYLEKGEYEKVEEYARKGILASTQDQPTVSIGYLYYLLALSLDAQRMVNRIDGKAFDRTMIKTIVTAYQTADQLFLNEGRSTVAYRSTIKAKLIIIAMEEGLTMEADPSE